MRPEIVLKYAGIIAANVALKSDYYLNSLRRLLIVEGATDSKFIIPILQDDTDCIEASRIINSKKVLIGEAPISNCKEVIVDLIRLINSFPSPFFAYPRSLDKWPLFGLVDLDYDELESIVLPDHLFVTDTHDLETLLLATDEDVLSRIDECEIAQCDFNISIFVAYQLFISRKLLNDIFNNDSFKRETISCGSRRVGFDAFLEKDRVSIPNLVAYISKNSDVKMHSNKMRSIIKDVLGNKMGRRYFDDNGVFKHSIDSFFASVKPNLWTSINGHDVLQLICFFNESADSAFGQKDDEKTMNRKFECRIIEKYDYANFRKTELYQKMKKCDVIKSIE